LFGEEDEDRALYQKTFDISDPTISYPGSIDGGPLSLFMMEWQAILVKHHINGDVILPSKEEMIKSYEEDLTWAREGKWQYLLLPSPPEIFRDYEVFYKMIPEGTFKGKNDAYVGKIMEALGPCFGSLFGGNFRTFKYENFMQNMPDSSEDTIETF